MARQHARTGGKQVSTEVKYSHPNTHTLKFLIQLGLKHSFHKDSNFLSKIQQVWIQRVKSLRAAKPISIWGSSSSFLISFVLGEWIYFLVPQETTKL